MPQNPQRTICDEMLIAKMLRLISWRSSGIAEDPSQPRLRGPQPTAAEPLLCTVPVSRPRVGRRPCSRSSPNGAAVTTRGIPLRGIGAARACDKKKSAFGVPCLGQLCPVCLQASRLHSSVVQGFWGEAAPESSCLGACHYQAFIRLSGKTLTQVQLTDVTLPTTFQDRLQLASPRGLGISFQHLRG